MSAAMKRIALLGSLVLLVGFGLSAASANARSYVPAFSAVHMDKGPVFREGCLIYGPKVESGECVYGSEDSKKKVVIFGDSHALQWTPALINIARKRHWQLIMLLRGNCTAALVNIDRVCNTWRRNSFQRIREEEPGLVFVASNTAPNVYVMDKGERLGRGASERVLRQGMYDTLLRIRKTGAEITVMRDLPMSRNYLPSECVSENRDNPGACTFKARRPLSQAYDFAAAKRLKRIQVIDPLPRVCPGLSCRAVHGNILKFRDRGHISATYSRTLTGWLNARLQNPFRP